MQTLHQCRIVSTPQLFGKLIVGGECFTNVGNATRHSVKNQTFVIKLRFLFDIGDAQTLLQHQQSVIELRLARNHS